MQPEGLFCYSRVEDRVEFREENLLGHYFEKLSKEQREELLQIFAKRAEREECSQA